MLTIVTKAIWQCYEVIFYVIVQGKSSGRVNLHNMKCHDISDCCLDNVTKQRDNVKYFVMVGKYDGY